MISLLQISDMGVLLKKSPDAIAKLSGSSDYPDIKGIVHLFQTKKGVILATRVTGLPNKTNTCNSNIFGFHIHEGTACTGNAEDPFAETGGHYNPSNCSHPHHAGDLPPLFGNNGFALMSLLTNRFTVADVIGHTVVVHRNPDDFTTQPAGNSGPKIACGIIRRR